MSEHKLKKMIHDLCPDGVPFLPLHQISIMERGTSVTRKSVNPGSIPVISGGREPAYYCDKPNRDGDIITVAGSGAGAGYVQYWKTPIFVADAFSIRGALNISTKYLYHFLTSMQDYIYSTKTGGGIPHVHISSISNLKVPIPPLQIQTEIVRVLDNFTNLTAELSAELSARNKQYEYYRNKLLESDNDTNSYSRTSWRDLSDIAEIGTGNHNTDEAVDNGIYPFFVRSQDPLRINSYEFDETAIITAGDGVGVGKVYHYISGKYSLHQRAYRIHVTASDVLPRYVFHYMKARFYPYIQKSMYQGSVPSIRRPMLAEFLIPIIPLAGQEKIIHILDNFETICTDLNIGLPAEIDARQKQYEYYRDTLLTFAETGTPPWKNKDLIVLFQYVFGFAQISLGDIGPVCMCKRIMKAETSSSGDIPFYKIGTFGKTPDAFISESTYKSYKAQYPYPKIGDILISAAGTIGRAVIYDGQPAYYQDSNIVWIDNDESIVLNRYLYYFYQSNPWKAAQGGTIARLYNDNIRSTLICVPRIDRQREIISILDHFDALCNDLTSGLPAEIEARQKQYEYYRDKLLAFPELKS